MDFWILSLRDEIFSGCQPYQLKKLARLIARENAINLNRRDKLQIIYRYVIQKCTYMKLCNSFPPRNRPWRPIGL
jgi:hypothetical protein